MPTVFLQQRLFPTLRLGIRAGVTYNNHQGSVHSRQGMLDRSCGVHCAAMALSLLGRIKYPGSLPKRERGVAARLWAAAQTIYFDGMENDGLAELLSSISAGLRIDRFPGCHRKTLTFTLANLADGGLAIVSWRTKDAHSHHWVLAVGVEGIQSGKTFKPSTLLVLDPLLAEPLLCGYNGRIQLNSHPIRGSQVYVEYVANDGTSIPVTLTSAVAMHELE